MLLSDTHNIEKRFYKNSNFTAVSAAAAAIQRHEKFVFQSHNVLSLKAAAMKIKVKGLSAAEKTTPENDWYK